MLKRVLCVSWVVVVAGCMDGRGIGDQPEDQVALADAPALKHVAEALESGGAATAAELFRESKMKFARAPDPTALLTRTHEENHARAPDATVQLSLLTQNVALLEARPLGIPYRISPDIGVRRAVMPAMLMSMDYDVIAVQEAWNEDDVNAFRDQGPGLGYRAFAQDRAEYNDGLVILVRESIIDGSEAPQVAHAAYTDQDPTENFPGINIKRGWMSVSFKHPQAGRIHVFNTHMQAFSDAWMKRMTQARELGLQARDTSPDGEIALVAGDMNAGPYYRRDAWKDPSGKDVPDWWRNSVSWAVAQHYGHMVDAFAAAQEAQDVHLGNTVANNWRRSTEVPGSEEGWCARTPHVVFTASDCNTVYFRQYAGTEYPARLDHVMLRDPSARVHVVGGGLENTAVLAWPDGRSFELSDHYGVGVSLQIRP